MKYLVLVFTMLFAMSAFATAYDHNSYDGDGTTVKSRRQVFTFVLNSASAAFAEGQVVCHDLATDDGIGADLCTSEGDPAAYCMVAEACAVGVMCKCLIEGFTDDLTFDGSGDAASTGDAIYADVNGKAAAVTVDTTAEAAYKIIGTYLDAVSTSVDVEAYIKF